MDKTDKRKERLIELNKQHIETAKELIRKQKLIEDERMLKFNEIKQEIAKLAPFYQISVEANGTKKRMRHGLFTVIEDAQKVISITQEKISAANIKGKFVFDIAAVMDSSDFLMDLKEIEKTHDDISNSILCHLGVQHKINK